MTSEEVQEIAKKERCAIISHRSGPALVVAGPGSGKTTTLAERFVSLWEENSWNPSRIVALTFTNYAADEMKGKVKGNEKVKETYGESEIPQLHIRTLHSLAKGLLHKYHDTLNLSSRFRIAGKLEDELLLEDVRLELKNQSVKLGKNQKGYLRRFRASKAFVADLDAIARLPSGKGFAAQEQFDQCYGSLLKYYDTVDWYDVVALAVKLLQEHEDVRSRVAGEIDHLLVDEYQDLNRADHELIRLLATKTESLMVFGDDDQSIYQTGRFANPEGVRDFETTYPNTKTHPLSICWRCGSLILDAAWRLIALDENRRGKKKPVPNPDRGYGKVEIRGLKSEKAEIEAILKELQEELNNDPPPKDILVLFHTREIGLKCVQKMLSNGLDIKNLIREPQIVSEAASLLYEALCLLRNDSDNLAARFLLKKLFEQDASWIAEKRLVSQERGISLWQSAIANSNTPQAILSWSKKSEEWRQMDNVLEILRESASAVGVIDDPETKKIINWAGEQTSITLDKIIDRLGGRFDFEEQESEESEEGTVIKVMTMHGAKGIEADVVFVPALEDELIPNEWYEPEQRRLLYVSMTRPKRRLILSWAWSRTGSATYRGPKRAVTKRDCSRFLKDIKKSTGTLSNE